MSDIFISYASEDRDRVKPLAKALENQGWSVWWDRTIPPGKTFDQVIEEAINAARCVVVLWSKISIKSDWVKEEANIGKERNILVPARIDPVDLPLGFGRIQAADLTNWEAETSHPGFLSLRNAISEVAGPPPERDKSVQDAKLPESILEQQLEVKSKERETVQPAPSHLKPDEKESPITGPKAPRKKRLAFGIGGIALILVLSVIGWFLYSKPGSYTIKASSGPNGSISPTDSVAVTRGDSMTFTIKPNPGSRIADVRVDGKSVGVKSSYTFENVTADHTIVASFAKEALASYTINALSGPNGSISPMGSVPVTHGDSKRFTITPSQGYRIADVRVDGKSVGVKSEYEFKNVTSDRTIVAGFESEEPPIPELAKLLNKNSSKYLVVAGADERDGGNVVIWDDIGQKDIWWYLEPQGKDRYKIQNKNSGKYLAVAGAAATNGANVIQWQDQNQPDIVWCLK